MREVKGEEEEELVNRTKGFVNLSRFKSGRAIKQLSKITSDWHKVRIETKRRKNK